MTGAAQTMPAATAPREDLAAGETLAGILDALLIVRHCPRSLPIEPAPCRPEPGPKRTPKLPRPRGGTQAQHR